MKSFRLLSKQRLNYFSSKSFSTQTALVTGANRGLGLEWVKQLINTSNNLGDFRVYACCRNPSTSDELNQFAKNNPNQIEIRKLETQNDDDIISIGKELQNAPIDLLILNAAIWDGQDFGSLERKNFVNSLDINVVSSILVLQQFYQNVLNSSRKQVISISSGAGSIGNMDMYRVPIYRTTKTALNMAVTSIYEYSRQQNDEIYINSVCPGWVNTDMGSQNGKLDPPLTTEQSVVKMIQNVVSQRGTVKNGGFYNREGVELPW